MVKTEMALCLPHEIGFMENAPQMPVILLASGNKVAKNKKINYSKQ